MNGLIRLEDAIKAINDTPCHSEFIRATFRCAISALEQEPCTDVVSREAVLDTLERMDKALDVDRTVENYKDLLKESYQVLPSVTQKSGKWLLNKEKSHFFDVYECSNCAKISGLTNYCPNCGAKMESEDKE